MSRPVKPRSSFPLFNMFKNVKEIDNNQTEDLQITKDKYG